MFVFVAVVDFAEVALTVWEAVIAAAWAVQGSEDG